MDGRRDGLNEGLLDQRREKWQMGEGSEEEGSASIDEHRCLWATSAFSVPVHVVEIGLSSLFSFSHRTWNEKSGGYFLR